jgi:signal transduction histidine kinase
MNELHHALEVRTQRNRDFVDDVAHEVKGPIAAMQPTVP